MLQHTKTSDDGVGTTGAVEAMKARILLVGAGKKSYRIRTS